MDMRHHCNQHQLSSHIKRLSSLGVLVSGMFLLGCEFAADQSTAKPNQSNQETPTGLLSPSHSLTYGHESALYRYLSKRWQVAAINEMPVQQGVILDFNKIADKQASLTVGQGCQPIEMKFEIVNATTGAVGVSEIRRELSQCSDGFEDDLMSALADVIYLEYATEQYNEEHIVLISYQDKILLTPAP